MRIAFVMKLKPGMAAEYKKRHDVIWPGMLEKMRREGTRNFSIYRHGVTLFAYLESDAPEPTGAATDPLLWKWWEWMAPCMETNPDFSPVVEPVEEMFHAD